MFEWSEESPRSWFAFFSLLAVVFAGLYVAWIDPDSGMGTPFVDAVESISSNHELVMMILLVIFGVAHSGLAALRPAGEKLVGERAYRVGFALVSLPLALTTVMYFINHRYSGIPLYDLRDVPGVHETVWLLSFASFFFLYPSTFNILEVAAVDVPKVHLWETGVIRITRHPQMVGQVLWSLAHCLWMGNSFAWVTSFGLCAYHLFGCWHGDRRLQSKIDTSASMLNGDFGPSRWVAQKTLVQNICDSILSGSPEKQLSSFFGLVHSNTSKTALGVLPCKGNYLSLMESLESLTYNAEEDNSIDLSKSLRLLKLSLKQEGRAPPRVVILTSSVPSCEEPLVKISDKVGRVDCIYLRGANENAEEEADMREYCAQHFGKLLCLDPFDAYGQETWEWQEDLLCQLALSHKERSCPFDFNAEEGSTRFSHQRGLRFPDPHGKSRSTMKMVDSCRGESLDSYQHLSSDGFAHSWLPSYSNLAKKYEEKVLPGAWYLVIMDSLCKWQTVFSCKAGRMVSKASRHEPGKRVLEPRPRRGLLKLLYSADIDSWCMQWKQDDESEVVQGLPPLVAREREPEDELSIRFTGPSKIKLEAVPCETGEVIGAHLVSTPYKRQHVFFWLQEEFTSEHGGGAKGLVRKLEDAIRKEGQEHTSSSRNPLLTIGSEKIQFESVLLNLMSSCNSKTQQARCPISGKRGDGGMLNAKESNESEMGAMEEEDDLDKGFYSWTAKLDADLTDVERKLGSESNLAQMQTSHKAPPTAAGVPPGTEVNEEDSSMLFELD